MKFFKILFMNFVTWTIFITSQMSFHDILGEIFQLLGKSYEHDVSVPESCLDDSPIGNSTVSRDGIKIQVTIKVIFCPFHLSNEHKNVNQV